MKDEHWYEGTFHCIYKIDKYMPDTINEEYGMVGVRDKWVNKAILSRKYFVVVAPKGSKQYNPKMIKKEMKKKLFKQVGLYVDDPMLFYPLAIPNNGQIELERWGVIT